VVAVLVAIENPIAVGVRPVDPGTGGELVTVVLPVVVGVLSTARTPSWLMRVGIVGAGIVGLAIGREIIRRRPGTRIVVLEKEGRIAAHQTRHNSGVVHAGIYYRPGSLKALLCTRGAAMLREYCAHRRLPYDECGKLVVAVSEEDVARLDALATRAAENAVPGLRRVGLEEIREIEPYATGLAALYSPPDRHHRLSADRAVLRRRRRRGRR
jgi:glycine/D-amino acid oxidase-like deaminating enzyme